MKRVVNYVALLPPAKQVLWCYLLWYLTMVVRHFDVSPRLWLTSLGISLVIGVGLVLSVASSHTRPDFWTIARLFMMPFCVSSFSALVKDEGFVLVFSPHLGENLQAALLCLLVPVVVRGVRVLVTARAMTNAA